MNIDDNFFHAFNSSRCKTAMLIISIIITTAFAYAEATGNQSEALQTGFILIVGFWSGRTTKGKDIAH